MFRDLLDCALRKWITCLDKTTFWAACTIFVSSYYIQFAEICPPRTWVFFGYDRLVPKLFGGSLPSSAEFWGFIYIGIFIFLWRVLTVQSCVAQKIQAWAYQACGKWLIFFQWHTFFHAVLLWEVNICLRNIRMYDWKAQPSLLWKLGSAHDPLPMWLWRLASYSPFACIGTFIAITLHLFRLWFLARKRYLINFEEFRKTDLVIVCIMLPSWFSITALYSQVRIWQVVGGDMAPSAGKMDYLSLFHADLALAVFVEVLTIFAFAKLTMKQIERPEYQKIHGKPAVYWLTMNGVLLCVVTIILQSVFRIVALINLQLIDRQLVVTGQLCGQQQLQNDVPMMVYCTLNIYTHKLDLISTAGVLLCAYNMYFVCNLHEVEEVLPRANLKFTATRLLIMVAQIQSKVLMPASITVPDYEAQFLGHLDGFTCALIHVSAMQYEVCVIALAQFFIWTDHFKQEKTRALIRATTCPDNQLDTSLLDDHFALDGEHDQQEPAEYVKKMREAVVAVSVVDMADERTAAIKSESSEAMLARIDNCLSKIEAMDDKNRKGIRKWL